MLLASWAFYTILKGFRSFNAENVGSVGQRAANLPAIKLWEWLDRDRGSNPGRVADWGRGRLADIFLRPPTLIASNFAALWPTDPKFLTLKDLNPLKKYSKNQEASSILKVVFVISKWPHLHRAYLLWIWYSYLQTVGVCQNSTHSDKNILKFSNSKAYLSFCYRICHSAKQTSKS